MKKSIAVVTATALMLLGGAGMVYADSAAMKQAEQANQEPLSKGDGVTESQQDMMSGESEQKGMDESGHSASTDDSIDAMQEETDGKTDIKDAEDLDSINAQGQSDAAAAAQKSQ